MAPDFTNSAAELISRHSKEAVAYMDDRIKRLKAQGDDRELDHAYRLLSEVEKLLSEET